MKITRRGVMWALGAVLGIVVTVTLTWSVSRLAGQRIGLSSVPASVTEGLVPRPVAGGKVGGARSEPGPEQHVAGARARASSATTSSATTTNGLQSQAAASPRRLPTQAARGSSSPGPSTLSSGTSTGRPSSGSGDGGDGSSGADGSGSASGSGSQRDD